MSTANKLTYLNVTKQKLKQAINNIGGEVTDETTFRQYVNQLDGVYDVLPKTEFQEGTSVTIEGGLKGKIDFDDGKVGFGQASQESTQGYNLLDENTLSQGAWNGTTTTRDYFYSNYYLEAGTYTIVTNLDTTNFRYAVNIATNQFPVPSGQTIDVYDSSWLTTSNKTFTISQDGYLGVGVKRSNEGGITPSDISNYSFMVYKGNYDSTKPYEQYTGGYSSPSPNWEQEVKCVRGKNLLPLNEADFTQTFYGQNVGIKDEVIKISGSTTQVYSISIGKNGVVIPSDTSRITFKVNSGTYKYTQFNSGTSYSGINVRLKDEDTDTMYTTGSTITLTETHTFSINIFMADTNSKNAEIKIQLEKGTTSTPYLPYNTIEEVVSGINLNEYNINSATNKFQSIINLKNSITFKANNIYTLVFDTPNTGIAVYHQDIEGITWDKYSVTLNGTRRFFTFTIGDNDITTVSNWGIILRITDTSEISTGLVTNVMLYEGEYDSSIPYEPYITPTSYQLSLGDIELCGIGNYKDYIYKNDGKWYKRANIGKEIFTGEATEYWSSAQSENKHIHFKTIQDKKIGRYGLYSQYYKYAGTVYVWQTIANNQMAEEDSNSAIFIRDDNILSKADFITWLSTHYLIVYYVLATPQDTEITDTALINQLEAWYNAHSNNGTTIITSNGNLPMIIKVRALKGE